MSKPAEEVWSWVKEQLGDKASMLIATLVFVAFGIGWARAEVRAAAKEDLDPIRIEQERQRAQMERYENEVREFRLDVRELYKVTPWVRPSQRLEQPLSPLDGGR